MKKITVYNSNYINPVTIILNKIERIIIDPKEMIQIETNACLGDDDFRIESDLDWKEAYHGRQNENLILRLEY